MKLPINELEKYVSVKHSNKELVEIFLSLGFEGELIDDGIIDLEITPNRGDCACVLGLAREYAAKTDQKINFPQLANNAQYNNKAQIKEIYIQDTRACPRYTGAVINGVKVKSSSPTLQARIKSFGMDPINNVVDITNLVMMEQGIPMHSFDFDLIKGNKMTIREAKEGETLMTLDKKINHLVSGVMVIEDAGGLMDLAGIMGGERSSIKATSTKILLQAAVFDRKIIRQTAKLLDKNTEASYRYERGIDAEKTKEAIEMAIKLLKNECSQIKIVEKIDINNLSKEKKIIEFNAGKVKKLLGIKIDQKFIEKKFNSLGIKKINGKYKAPSWRHDLLIEEDLIEEIARMFDLTKIKPQQFTKTNLNCRSINKSYYQKLKIKNRLIEQGFTEILSYTFISDRDFGWLNLDKQKMLTPIKAVSKEFNYLRPSLLVGMLKVFSQNRWCYSDGMKLFEIGSVFYLKEMSHIAIASYTLNDIAQYTKEKNKIIFVDDSHSLYRQYNLKKAFYFLEMDLSIFPKNINHNIQRLNLTNDFNNVSDFPPMIRDIAIVVDGKISSDIIMTEIKKADKSIKLVEQFDEFTSSKFEVGKKSLAYHLIFDNKKRTMAKEESDRALGKIIEKLKNKFQAKLRE